MDEKQRIYLEWPNGVCTQHAKHAKTRGVPPGNFLKIDTEFSGILVNKNNNFLVKLKISCMIDIWKNISTATVIIPSAHACV